MKADLVFINGNVLTMNDVSKKAKAVAVRNGSIVLVGENEDALALKGEKTEVVDLEGKTSKKQRVV